MEVRLNCKMVKDNQRTIIVIEGSTAERDKLVSDILSVYYNDNLPSMPSPTAPSCSLSETQDNTSCMNPNHLRIPVVEDLEEVQSDDNTSIPTMEEISHMEDFTTSYSKGVIICNGKYKGMTAAQALSQDKEIALTELFDYAKRLPNGTHEKEEIVKHCKQYMFNLPNMKYYYTTRKAKLDFLFVISKIVTLQPFIMGYRSLADFSNVAQDMEIERVFDAVTQSLQDRATQNATVRLLNE